MLLKRSALYLIILTLLFSRPVEAEELRFINNDAIISAPFRKLNNNASTYQINRIKNESFASLSQEHLSDIAVRVSIKRKIRNGTRASSRFLNSRSPCNTPTIKRLLRISKTLICEPNWEVKIILTPNDTSYSQVYAASATGAARLHLPEAWNLTTGSSNVAVAVIDTGFDYNHPDLLANIWTNPGEIPANGIDDDGDGYIDDVHGIDPCNGDSDPFDDQSHGTHVSGTIGAVGNNARGVEGIAWNVTLIGCKAFNASGIGTSSAIISCLNYIVNLKNHFGVNIVATSNSYGGFPYLISMYNAIAASQAAHIVYVAGAGNNSSNNDTTPFYPASYDLDNIISVGAVDSQALKANFSNFGATSVDIFAPGVNILSTIPGNQYAFFSGTSMATPHVTGAIALLMSYHPEYTYSQAISSILNTGTTVAGLAGQSVTGAIVNVENALNYAAPTPTPIPTTAPSTPIPTEVPTVVPTQSPDPDLSTAKLDISVTNSRSRSLVACGLSAFNGSEFVALTNYGVTLTIKGARSLRRATTNIDGLAKFVVRPPKGKSYSAQCVASLTDPRTERTKIFKSRLTKLKLTKS